MTETVPWSSYCTAMQSRQEWRHEAERAKARAEKAESDRSALLKVARAAHGLRSIFHDTDLVGEAAEVAEQPWKDMLDEALDELPEHLKPTED